MTLDYKNFATFYEIIIFCKEVESYAIEHYLDLTCFVESWSSYKKHRFVPLVRPKRTPQSVWRLQPWGVGLRWVCQCDTNPYNNIPGVHH